MKVLKLCNLAAIHIQPSEIAVLVFSSNLIIYITLFHSLALVYMEENNDATKSKEKMMSLDCHCAMSSAIIKKYVGPEIFCESACPLLSEVSVKFVLEMLCIKMHSIL